MCGVGEPHVTNDVTLETLETLSIGVDKNIVSQPYRGPPPPRCDKGNTIVQALSTLTWRRNLLFGGAKYRS